MREALRGALLSVLFFGLMIGGAPAVAEEEVHECDDCEETLIIKGEPYTFPTSWLYSPGGYGWGVHGGGIGGSSADAGIANLPTPYEMLLIKEGARKAACKGMAAAVLTTTGGKEFFSALAEYVKKAGAKQLLKRVGTWGGVALGFEIWYFLEECPDFWGGSTYSHTDSIG
ncbi:MAG: hypothetical protein OXG74_19730 [Acidobacteria bacterium]|nr:hypothetical protein [Acidobacteriota bacterium]